MYMHCIKLYLLCLHAHVTLCMRQHAETSCQSTTAWLKVRVRVQRLSHIAGRVCVSAYCHLVNMHMTPDLHNLVPYSHYNLW